MIRRLLTNFALVCAFSAAPSVYAGAPLPLHSIEGFGGILLTGSAYLVNPSDDNSGVGLPSVSAAYASLDNDRDLRVFTITETLGGRVELGYGYNRLDLGDLRSDVLSATGLDLREDAVELHNFNLRALLVKEGGLGQSWMPAVTLGLHYKTNETVDDIDKRLLGTLDGLGIKDDDGVDVTLYATKLFTSLPRPVMVNVGVRSTKAAHIGLLGFTDDRETLMEANFGVLVLDNLVIGGEFRQKPDEYTSIPGLIEDEKNWWSAFITYVVNDQLTVSAAYADLGHVLNHRDNEALGVKFKYEF